MNKYCIIVALALCAWGFVMGATFHLIVGMILEVLQ